MKSRQLGAPERDPHLVVLTCIFHSRDLLALAAIAQPPQDLVGDGSFNPWTSFSAERRENQQTANVPTMWINKDMVK